MAASPALSLLQGRIQGQYEEGPYNADSPPKPVLLTRPLAAGDARGSLGSILRILLQY